MSGDDVAKAANALAEAGEHLGVLTDWAKGQRAILERDGWSPTVAEQIAAHMLLGLYDKAMKG